MTMKLFGFVSALLLCSRAAWARTRKDGNKMARNIQILNRSGVKVDYFWINPTTGTLADSTMEDGLINGADSPLNSYIGHSFEVHELPRKSTGTCAESVCRKATFTVSANEDQIFTINPDFEVEIEDHKTKAKQKAKDALQACKELSADSSLSAEEKISKLAECMEKELQTAIDQTDDEIDFQRSVRKQMGQSWAEYACHDVNATSTASIVNETWRYTHPTTHSKNSFHALNVFFFSEHEKVQRVQNFITPSECQAVREAAQPNPKATIRNHELAIPLKVRKSNAEIDELMNKIESLVSSLTGMQASMSNKDPMIEVSIREASQGECELGTDGTCAASPDISVPAPSPGAVKRTLQAPHVVDKNSGVVVTVLVVCEAPKAGGHIHFPKTGTSLLPGDMVGSVIVVQHEMDGQKEADPYLNEFVMCPVQEGSMVTLMDHMSK